MADTRPLISIDQLKSYINESPDYTANDELYKMAISATTYMFELSTRRNFTKQTHTQYATLLKNSNRTIRTKNWPISDVLIYYKDVDNLYYLLTEDTDYFLNKDLGEIEIFNILYFTNRNIKIEYTSGYAPTNNLLVEDASNKNLTIGYTIPDDLKLAALQYASTTAKSIQTNCCSDTKQKITTNNKSIYTNNTLAVLAKYTRPIVII